MVPYSIFIKRYTSPSKSFSLSVLVVYCDNVAGSPEKMQFSNATTFFFFSIVRKNYVTNDAHGNTRGNGRLFEKSKEKLNF